MRAIRLLAVVGVVLMGVAGASDAAFAEPLLKPPSPVPTPNDDALETPLVPPAADTLGGHIVAAADVAYVFPWGYFSKGESAQDLGDGVGVGLDLGYGLSRSVVIGLWGQYAWYGQNPDCGTAPRPQDGCTATSFALGPFVRYHLVQGMRFDPWLLAGMGYRSLTVTPSAGSFDYAGIEWARIALGGDYYPVKYVGFGPMLELDIGVFGKTPGASSGPAAHFNFVGGLRVVVDVPGK